jgi:hypothetical protein
MSEAIASQLSQHPADNRHRVDEDATIATDTPSALEPACRGEVLTWTARDNQDQRARREAGGEIPERPLTGSALIFAEEVPDISRNLPVSGLPGETSAIRPVSIYGTRKGVVLFSKDRGV